MRDALRTVLNPKSVAVIGASENENKIGGTRRHVSAAGACLREARQRSPGHEAPDGNVMKKVTK
ncbi:MAG: hypothetical protein ABL878_08805 [Burkholderiales bacterium]